MIEAIYTIGVYGATEDSFFDAIAEAKIDLFYDVRQRRGLRGKTYAFANSTYLQSRLNDMGIAYIHDKSLAPTSAIRQIEKDDNVAMGVSKRQRETLSAGFISAYQHQVLEEFDVTDFVKNVDEYHRVCLFCVERLPEACHRSLIAIRLKEVLNIPLIHLMP